MQRRLSLLFLLPVMALAETQVPLTSDVVAIGRGYDSLRAQLRGDCVEFAGVPVPVAGEILEFALTEVANEQDLATALNVSVSAKYGPVSGAGSYLREQRINSFSSWMFVSLRVKVRSESSTPTKIKAADFGILASDYPRFREKCGDGFILSRAIGGEFSALVELKTRSQSDKTDISAKLASGVPLSGTAETKSRVEQVLKDRSSKVTVVRGGGEGVLNIDAKDLLKAILDFPDQIKARPAEKLLTYRVVVQDYLTLNVPPRITATTFSNLEKVVYIAEADALARRVRQHIADIRYLTENPDQFGSPNVPPWQQALSTHESALRTIETAIVKCVESSTACGDFKPAQWTPSALPNRLDGPTRAELAESVANSRAALDSIFTDIALGNRLVLDCWTKAGRDDLSGERAGRCMLNELRDRCSKQGCRPK